MTRLGCLVIAVVAIIMVARMGIPAVAAIACVVLTGVWLGTALAVPASEWGTGQGDKEQPT